VAQRDVSALAMLFHVQTGNAQLTDDAAMPSSPRLPRTTADIATGTGLHLFLGIAVALPFYRIYRRTRTPGEASATYALRLLEVVPATEAHNSAVGLRASTTRSCRARRGDAKQPAGKDILAEAGVLPHEVLVRKKTGFGVLLERGLP
jgi:hypothetical protein